MEQNHQLATFGAGCFWGVQQMYDQIPGVINTWVGYMGGDTEDPTYEQVCSDKTGHAEVVHIEYDPSIVSYERLLELFWINHDPTTLNRQGPDFGTQYRSVIFYHTEEQKEQAQASLEELDNSGKYDDPIVTQIVPAGKFYEAEEYHQKYFDKKGIIGRCHI